MAMPPRARPRLVAVNRCYGPDGSATGALLADLAERWAEEGPALVLAGRSSYATGAVLPASERRKGVDIRRLRTTRFGRRRLLGRAIDELCFYLAALLSLLRHLRPNDLLLVKTDPPLLPLVGALAAHLRGTRLVVWCQDVYPELAAALGIGLAGGAFGRLLRVLRTRALAAATVVVPCPVMAARLVAAGLDARIEVVANWADGGRIRPVPPAQNPLRAAFGLGMRPVIGYSGNLGRAHAPDLVRGFIEAMARAAPELAFVVIGGGSGVEKLEACGARLLLRPYQPLDRLSLSLSVADAHLVSLDPACEGLMLPSKLYAALAAGRPVIALGDPDGALARLVEGQGLGLAWRPGRERDVLDLLARAREPAFTVRLRARFLSAFDKNVALARLEAVLDGQVPLARAA